MIIKIMQWMWLVTVLFAHLQVASTDNDTTTEVVPASEYYVELQTDVEGNYTEAVDATAESDDVNKSVHDVTSEAPSLLSTLVHVEHALINDTQSGNKTVDLVKNNGSKSAEGKSIGVESSQNESTELSGHTLTIEPLTTLQTDIITSNATETELQTADTQPKKLIPTLESVSSTLHPSSSAIQTSETLVDSSTVNSSITSTSTAGAIGRSDVTEDLVTSLESKTNSSSSRAATFTSISSVPQESLLTTPSPSTTTYPTSTKTSSTEILWSTEKTSPSEVKTVIVSETVSKEYEVLTTSELPVKNATPGFTQESLPGASTLRVTEEITDEDEYDEEYSDSVETEYERSLRTRRVINHAALWITIGFVVVLVSYITALVIYNRTRPDWQDSPRPYSRFENEPEDLPEYDDNNMEYDNYGVTDEFPQHENRRDFSQCVDPRDFPPCDSEQEYLLYEDPTYIDQATCTDFSYHDEC